eukprot:TRINITY_DN775992_c0_g1_i1.p1 TRINITY_DN775992_c0_g1~~TRINITY_DN775992_c0_g1_i1.p1  ORF type:complete len:388 (+),score=135.87 TRINITY_DN775992_c0_g1_i1:33-1196(+)
MEPIHVEDLEDCGFKPLTNDRLIWKKVIKDGVGIDHPDEGCPCTFQFIGTTMDGRIFDTTRDVVNGKHVGGTDDPTTCKIDRGDCIIGWDHALLSMHRNELAHFVMGPKYAYGMEGYAPRVGPDEWVQFEIELLHWKFSLPRMPTKEEMAESKRQRQQESEDYLKTRPKLDSCLDAATKEKEKANAFMKKQDYAKAKEIYDMAFVHLYHSDEEKEILLSPTEQSDLDNMKAVLHLNRSLANMKLGDLKGWEWDVNEGLKILPDHVRGLYRRSLFYKKKLTDMFDLRKKKQYYDVDKAQSVLDDLRQDIDHGLKLKPKDRSFILLSEQADGYQEIIDKTDVENEKRSKNVWKNKVFRKRAIKKKEPVEIVVEEEVDEDMPSLEESDSE